jgi:hypothetical protein
MKIVKFILSAVFILAFSSLYAYIPDNTEENQFQAKVADQLNEVTTLVNDGIKAIRQEVVSSTYASGKETRLNGGLHEGEAGEEEVTSKEILYYEPKEEIYEARDAMDEILIWVNMYRTTAPDDVVTFKAMKKYIMEKSRSLDKLINALKYEKDNKDTVMKAKIDMKKADKDFTRYYTRLKGKVLLIQGKPLPEPTKDSE